MNRLATLTDYLKPLALGLACCCSAVAMAADELQLDCVIEPSEVADVSSSVRGIMENVLVERGDWVKKGQVIAKLESSVERANVSLAQAEAEANSLIHARTARLALAEKRLARVLELSKTKSIASQALDEAETDKVLAQAELEQVLQGQHLAQLRLSRAKSVLALRSIQSPVTGTVQTVHVSAGESVEDRPIMTIVQIDPLYVEAIAPVQMFGQIKQDDTAHVYPEEPLGGVFLAKVIMVERVIDAPSGTFGVRLKLSNLENKLPAGLRCKVSFDTSTSEG